jgi:hypothetical protein
LTKKNLSVRKRISPGEEKKIQVLKKECWKIFFQCKWEEKKNVKFKISGVRKKIKVSFERKREKKGSWGPVSWASCCETWLKKM